MNNLKKFSLDTNKLSLISMLFILIAISYMVYIFNSRSSIAPRRPQAGSNVCVANFVVAPTTITPTITPTPPMTTIIITITPTPTPPTILTPTGSPTPTKPQAGCINYGVIEHSNENCSNIVKIAIDDPNNPTVTKLRTLRCAVDGICDAEAMENESKTVYMMANKNTKTIYQVFKDGGTKKVITLQSGSPRMEGLSFRSGDRLNIIWGGSPNTGNIYRINLNNGSVETVLDSNIWVKTIAWDNNGVKLYVSTRNKLLRKHRALLRYCPKL